MEHQIKTDGVTQQKASVLWNHPVSEGYWHLGLACRQGYRNVIAGQFVMVQTNSEQAPLLRRPFSIFGVIGEPNNPVGIEILYKIVGCGTKQMSCWVPDQVVDVLGPLGHGFEMTDRSARVVLLAGGIGVAPIRFLAKQLTAAGREGSNVRVFIGGRSAADLLCRDDFEQMGMTVSVTTDDGSLGDQCLITDPLTQALQNQRPDILFACGPHGMLRCVADLVKAHRVPCQLSLETLMACGMGACLGCAVPAINTSGPYLHVCLDGPVFDVQKVAF